MRFYQRLDVKLTALALGVVLIAAIVQSAVSILFIIRTYNEYSLQVLEEQWLRINRALAARGCREADCLREVARDFSFFDPANPAFFTDPDGRVLLVLPPDAGLDVGSRIEPRERMGDLYIQRAANGAELAFVRGDLRVGSEPVGYIYVYQYPVEEASATFGPLALYSPILLRGALVSLAVAAVLAAALIGLLTRRLRRLTDAVAAYDPEKGLVHLSFSGGDEITTLAARFQEMAARITALVGELQRAETARKQLIAGISHDLRSPVTSLGVGLELLEGTGADAKVVASLREDVEFLGRLIEDLFEIVQIRDRPGGPERKTELVGEIMERAARAVFPEAAARRIAIDVRAEGLPETMEVNGRLLFRLFDNLLRNAVRHGPEGSSVVFSAVREENAVRFEVLDQGAGLDGDPAEVFERYVSRRKGGVGLGLSLAREVALAHGGTIEAANRPEGGARFTVRLPAAAGVRQG